MTEPALDDLQRTAPEVTDANASPLVADRGERIVAEPEARPDFSGIRGIYFDLDDTLCGYWDASKAGLRAAFREHGPEGFSVEEMIGHWAAAYRDFVGEVKTDRWYPGYCERGEPTRTEQMRRALARIAILDPAHADRLSEAYARLRDANLRLFDDAIEVLEELSARYPLGLITNGPADVQRQEIATVGIERFVGRHVFIEGEQRIGKPHAEVFRRAERSMGLGPDELLMVGNSYSHDVAGALAAGWRAVWIRRPSDVPPSANNDARPEEMPEGGLHPTAIVQSLRQLAELLPAG